MSSTNVLLGSVGRLRQRNVAAEPLDSNRRQQRRLYQQRKQLLHTTVSALKVYLPKFKTNFRDSIKLAYFVVRCCLVWPNIFIRVTIDCLDMLARGSELLSCCSYLLRIVKMNFNITIATVRNSVVKTLPERQ